MGRTIWIIERSDLDGYRAVEHTVDNDGDPENPTGTVIGPFPDKPDLETALLKAGVGFMDRREA